MIDNDFIEGIPLVTTLEGDAWNPKTSQFEKNEASLKNADIQMLAKGHMETVLVKNKDFTEDENNYDIMTDIELMHVKYLDMIFNSTLVMYIQEAECASTITRNQLLLN